jgi:WD40 repeat protein
MSKQLHLLLAFLMSFIIGSFIFLEKMNFVDTINVHKKPITSIDYKENIILSSSEDGTCSLIDLRNKEVIQVLETPNKTEVSSAIFSKENEKIIFFSSGQYV